MLWTVKQASLFLLTDTRHVYYLLEMSEIEAVKVGRVWRILPEGVREYASKPVTRIYRKASCNFINSGNGEFPFCQAAEGLQHDSRKPASGMERRRGKLVHSARRPEKILLSKHKPLIQLDLFISCSPLIQLELFTA